jgi:hypothetical protein
MKMRQDLWPSSGTLFDGFMYMMLSIEETAYFIARSYVLVIGILLLGVLFRLCAKGNPISGKKLLYALLFSAPFAYLLVTGFLIGLTPSLWIGAERSEEFRILEHWLAPHLPMNNITAHGGFAIRQNLFLYLGLFLDIFLAGFLAAGLLIKPLPQIVLRPAWLAKAVLAMMVIITFLFHPDGTGGIRVLSVLLKNNFGIENFNAQKYVEGQSSVIQRFSPNSHGVNVLGEAVFKRNRQGQHDAAIASIAVDNYFKENKGGFISADVLDLIYSRMDKGYNVSRETSWIVQIFAMYGVRTKEECHRFWREPETDSVCYNSFGEKRFIELLAGNNISRPQNIPFDTLQGVEIKSRSDCTLLADTATPKEHFIATGDWHLSKGVNFFEFETSLNKTELYIYVIGEKIGILYPWLNQPNGSGGWTKHGENNILEPIASQVETSSRSEKLRIIVYSAKDQNLNSKTVRLAYK